MEDLGRNPGMEEIFRLADFYNQLASNLEN